MNSSSLLGLGSLSNNNLRTGPWVSGEPGADWLRSCQLLRGGLISGVCKQNGVSVRINE